MELTLSCLWAITCTDRHVTDVSLINFSILSWWAEASWIKWVRVAGQSVLWLYCVVMLLQGALDLNMLKSGWSVLESALVVSRRTLIWSIQILTWMWLLTMIQIAAHLPDHMVVLRHRIRLRRLCIDRFQGGALISRGRYGVQMVLHLRLLEILWWTHTVSVMRSQDGLQLSRFLSDAAVVDRRDVQLG